MRTKPKDSICVRLNFNALQHFRGVYVLGFIKNYTPFVGMLFHLPVKCEQTCSRLCILIFVESLKFFLVLWQDGMNELEYGEPRDKH